MQAKLGLMRSTRSSTPARALDLAWPGKGRGESALVASKSELVAAFAANCNSNAPRENLKLD